ncbi:polysaccharide biosynthesis protein, partial [Methylobacterium radiotolerans]
RPFLAFPYAGGVVAGLVGPGAELLTMLGGERRCAGSTAWGLLAAAGRGRALGPALGTLGAAVAVAVASVGRAGLLARAAGRIHGLPTPVWAAGTVR